ncbi:glutathione S-transferase C-terminal domain-containing protein [Yinghuangia soli]|uniref:Glutathione S-transferase C-terminal domain-containing protein n=1 Tax=Yinghuangia soli TaxID=2908204 RepID=A0AA41U3I1_9ACTN|nr:glutathione S-transferase C-terminal domain-containing protein [Yinghuangia soli]MCF2531855.1 glutathione S-transferase C-terminal domain-containing protein [Yinghuangia soli]
MSTITVFASPVDQEVFGTYRGRPPSPRDGVERPLYPFQDRVSASGDGLYPAEPGRYHLYLAHGCPWAQIAAIVREAKGLGEAVTASYVDEARDGRGWAFRERFGPDPVNGFALLRDAYEATEPGYDGHISVPTLWDRTTSRVVSNDFPVIPVDLATRFDAWAANDVDLYPEALRADIDAFDARITADGRAGGVLPDSADSAGSAANALDGYETLLGEAEFVHGSALTLSDIRLWVKLIRFEIGYQAAIERDGRALPDYPNLWAYTQRLYLRPEFRAATHDAALREQRERLLGALPPGAVHEAAVRRDEEWAAS